MSKASQKAARSRRGFARFHVVAAESDRDLIRGAARKLAEGGPEAARLRADLRRHVGVGGRGGILTALRRSPLVGADVEFLREPEMGRLLDP